MKTVLSLISERVMGSSEYRRNMGVILQTLLSERGTDSSVLLCILDMIKTWIEDDYSLSSSAGSVNSLNPKEIVTYLQKLSLVDRKSFPSSAQEEWDAKYLELLYSLCGDSTK
jgi:transformation/transcription domain-associated protein